MNFNLRITIAGTISIFLASAGATAAFSQDNSFKTSVMDMAKEREKILSQPWNSPATDSANHGSTSKSWTVSEIGPQEKSFLQSLKWQEHKVGNYVLRTGLIFDKWIAAMQFVKNGNVVLTEITPPYEYVKMVDPLSAVIKNSPVALDGNKDGVLDVAFLHEKLNDAHYHMYTVYRLNSDCPQLIWKAGGKLGDWINGSSSSTKRVQLKIRSLDRQAAKVKAFQMTAPAAGQSIALGKKLNIRLVNVPYLRTPSKHGENLACGEPEMTFSLINSKGQRFEITDRNWNIETPDMAMQNFSIKIEKSNTGERIKPGKYRLCATNFYGMQPCPAGEKPPKFPQAISGLFTITAGDIKPCGELFIKLSATNEQIDWENFQVSDNKDSAALGNPPPESVCINTTLLLSLANSAKNSGVFIRLEKDGTYRANVEPGTYYVGEFHCPWIGMLCIGSKKFEVKSGENTSLVIPIHEH
ncbi:MAG: hypothetical protein IT343_11245 [Candidatus Melainabacteria bacterium]|nr:hypothetical protein [Candidatus Melainabacteria bacterium]